MLLLHPSSVQILQAGNEKSTNYFSVGNTTNKGVVPMSYFDQYNVSFRNSSKFMDDKLTLDANFIGSLQESKNRQTPGVISHQF